jgi:ABC-type Fe3+/spermidine/putrescine transport system ATPase subunit
VIGTRKPDGSAVTPIVEVRRLCKHYGGPLAVSDVSFSVNDGEFLSLLGASGSGKTTTLRMIAGLEIPTQGSVWFRGRDITHVPVAQRDMRMVFQDFALFPNLTVWDNVAFGLKLRIHRGRLTGDEIKARVGQYLDTVHLSAHAGKMPHQLSGGQRQRVSLARALVTDPPVVLFDEPLGSLDASMRKVMQLELKRLHRELKKTFIYVTHDQEEAMGLSDRVAVLKDGRLLQLGTPDDIYCRPNSPAVAGFIGAANLLQGIAEVLPGRALRVQLPGGSRLDATDDAADIANGETVTLMLRAEQIRLAPPGGNVDGGLRAQITERLFLGEKVRYELEVPATGLRLTAIAGADRPGLRLGDEVVVTADPRHVRVLPRAQVPEAGA